MAGSRSKGGRIVRWAVRAAAWLFTSALGLVDVFAIREAVLTSYLFLRLGRHGYALADKLSMLLLGILWFIFMLYTQYIYGLHSGDDVSTRRLRIRVTWVAAIEVAIIVATIAIRMVLR